MNKKLCKNLNYYKQKYKLNNKKIILYNIIWFGLNQINFKN